VVDVGAGARVGFTPEQIAAASRLVVVVVVVVVAELKGLEGARDVPTVDLTEPVSCTVPASSLQLIKTPRFIYRRVPGQATKKASSTSVSVFCIPLPPWRQFPTPR
jgi:hypothetical protein